MGQEFLDRLLVTLDVAVEAFAICEVRKGLRLVARPDTLTEVHYVLAGTLHLTAPGCAPLRCGPGSVVVVPPGTAQIMAADAGPARDVVAADNCAMARDGLLLFDAAEGGAGDLRMICGTVSASFAGSFGLLDQVRAPLAEDMSDSPLVRQAYAIMLDEIARPDIGTRALTGALMKACLVLVIRRYFARAELRTTLLGSVRDPRLGRAVMAVLDRPAARHSVAALAGVAGMSRSAFAREFRASLAMSPMELVARTRLHHAAGMLRSTDMSVKAVAGAAGFFSRSHFSRAFRETYGADPSSFRRTALLTELPQGDST